MKAFTVFAVALAAVVLAVTSAHGRPQPQMFCWSPDVEFPVACEQEEEDEGYKAAAGLRISARGAGWPVTAIEP